MSDSESINIIQVEVQQDSNAVVYTGEGIPSSGQTTIIGPYLYERGRIKPVFQMHQSVNTGETTETENCEQEDAATPSQPKSYRQTTLNFSATTSEIASSSSQLQTTALSDHNPVVQTPVKKSTSVVRTYFQYSKLTNKAKCLIDGCTQYLAGNNITNLKKHLQHLHFQVFQSLPKEENKEKPEDKKQQALLFCKKYPPSHPKQQKFLHKLTWWVAANPVPNSVVENEEFIEMIKEADPKLAVPSRPTMEKSADRLFEEAGKTVKQLLESMRKFTLLSDIWTKKGYTSSFLGVSVTGYSCLLKRKINLLLSVKKFETITHRAEDVLSEMNRVSRKFDLKVEKVWRAMTDGGSEMVSSHRNQNTFLQNLISKDQQHRRDEEINIESVEYELPTEVLGVPDEELEVLGVSEYRRIPCFIHAMLRCLDQIDSDTNIQSLLKKMRQVVSIVTTSSKKTQLLIERTKEDNKTGIKLVTFSNTRKWNANYLVAARLLRVQIEFSKILEEYELKSDDLDESEWECLFVLKEFLEPFFDATNTSSREEDLVASFLIIQIKSLHDHLNAYLDSEFLSNAAQKIKDKLDEKFGHWIDYPQPNSNNKFEGSFLAATLLDPRYRYILSQEEKDRAKWYIINEHSPFNLSIQQPTTPEPVQVQSGGGTKRKSVQAYLSHQKKIRLEKKVAENIGTISNSLAEEVESFLIDVNFDDDDEDGDIKKNQVVLQFWESQSKKYPLLAPLALDYLCLPTSIALVEQTFSLAGIATKGQRNRLDGDHLDREVFLSKNKKNLQQLMHKD